MLTVFTVHLGKGEGWLAERVLVRSAAKNLLLYAYRVPRSPPAKRHGKEWSFGMEFLVTVINIIIGSIENHL